MGSPASARTVFPSFLKSNTMTGSSCSMHIVSAVRIDDSAANVDAEEDAD